MSESTSTPDGDDDRGTFVGGSFGPDEVDEGRSTAAQIEDEQEGERHFAAGPGPAAAAEFLTQPSDAGSLPEDVEGVEDTGDVEGTGDAVPPGERNEPV